MNVLNVFTDYSLFTIFALTLLSFTAGFVDAVVGGGGLIQLPALLINLPNAPLPTLFGTNKMAALSGTSVAAYQYSKRVKFNIRLLLVVALFAFIASFLGAKTVSVIEVDKLKPIILLILVFIAVYTFIKKDLGAVQSKKLNLKKQLLLARLLAVWLGSTMVFSARELEASLSWVLLSFLALNLLLPRLIQK